jgi:uncharacterized protein YndB with AHSA1/START domain
MVSTTLATRNRVVARDGRASVDRVERRIVLATSREEVWAALTEPARLSAWIGAEVALDVRAGGRGTARRGDGAMRRIRVETVDPPRLLVFRWWPYEHDGRPGRSTRVEFRLEEREAAHTLLTVTESGLPGSLSGAGAEPDVFAGAQP